MLSNCRKRAAPSINLTHWTIGEFRALGEMLPFPPITRTAQNMKAIETKGSTHPFHTQNQGEPEVAENFSSSAAPETHTISAVLLVFIV